MLVVGLLGLGLILDPETKLGPTTRVNVGYTSGMKQPKEISACRRTQERLQVITGSFYNKRFGHYRRSSPVCVGGFDTEIGVKDNGDVTIIIDYLSMEALEELFEMLGGVEKLDTPKLDDSPAA